MTVIHGFELLRERDIPEINSKARLFRHVKTGAELLSLENEDENKVFGITFCTPPPDSSGLPHILEHSVLCGSHKYPVKEPFVELLKGSLATFINAMTFPDKTCYPVASQNVKDFYNLIDVYVDAVFYPRITPEILQQEGWHYELDNAEEPLRYKGVVFNEMKGVYSSPDDLLYVFTQQALFPDTPYGLDFGGDPRAIPDLTYEQFKRFHETYYHPSNARIYFYGDDDPEERLRRMDEYLYTFDALDIDPQIELQAYFDQPRHVVKTYDAGQDDEKKGMATVSWVLTETDDIEQNLAFHILAHILVGEAASPLRKALIDSGLGDDIAGLGLEADLRQMVFSTGLKGIAVENAAQVETLVLDTLKELANGVDRDTVAASLNTVEFQLREYNTGSFPRGIAMMFSSLTTWLYGGDPFAPLAFAAPLAAIKEKVEAGQPYFEGLIRGYLLENRHRTTLVLKPDARANEELEVAERQRLEQARAAMTPDDLQDVIESTQYLRQLQERPDPPEALASIPRLELEDIDRAVKMVPLEISEEHGCRVLYHDLFTNGIFYVDVGFDLQTLPQELLPYAGLFGTALLEMGTEAQDFVKLSQRIGSRTGGIDPALFTSQMRPRDEPVAWLFLRAKATTDRVTDLLDILRDILLTVRLDNPERLRQIVLKEKALQEARLVPAGHQVIDTRLQAHFHPAGWATEQMDGIEYLYVLRGLVQEIDDDWSTVLQKLEDVRRHLLNRRAMLCNVTVDAAGWQAARPHLAGFLEALPSAPTNRAGWSPNYLDGDEGLTIPAQVNYVGMGARLYDLGYAFHGSAQVISRFLSTTWLWDRIRVQGGAYGGFARFDPFSGVFSYLSYRDPNLKTTLENYRRTDEFLRELDLSPAEITRSIIGAIGQMDAYQLPDAKGYSSMQRHLIGYTDEMRQQTRDEVLATTLRDFKHFGEVLARLNERNRIVVLGSQPAIEAANRAGLQLDIKRVM
jgi:presequence protease